MSGRCGNQLFQNKICYGANGRIFLRYMRSFKENVFVCIWITRTVTWPVFINTAVIVGAQKRTRRTFGNVISVTVKAKISLDKSTFLHLQVAANAFYISCFKPWRIIFATIAALQAINFGKCFVVQLRQFF